jgi:hypothetical protein
MLNELEKGFQDTLIAGTTMYHVKADNTIIRIAPYSKEYWKIKDKIGRTNVQENSDKKKDNSTSSEKQSEETL